MLHFQAIPRETARSIQAFSILSAGGKQSNKGNAMLEMRFTRHRVEREKKSNKER